MARRVCRAVLQAMILAVTFPLMAHAQAAASPNGGALAFTGGLDLPTVYVFRGIVRETDPKLTMLKWQPAIIERRQSCNDDGSTWPRRSG